MARLGGASLVELHAAVSPYLPVPEPLPCRDAGVAKAIWSAPLRAVAKGRTAELSRAESELLRGFLAYPG